MIFEMSFNDLLSHLMTFIGGVAVGACGKYFADYGTELRKDRKARKHTVTQFEKLERVMPGLIAAIKQDLAQWPDVRSSLFWRVQASTSIIHMIISFTASRTMRIFRAS